MRKSFVGMWTTLFLASIVSCRRFRHRGVCNLHVYMLTAGHSFVGHVMPMITGFDEVDLSLLKRPIWKLMNGAISVELDCVCPRPSAGGGCHENRI